MLCRFATEEWCQTSATGRKSLAQMREVGHREPVALKVARWVMLTANIEKAGGFVNGRRGLVIGFSSWASCTGTRVGGAAPGQADKSYPVVEFVERTSAGSEHRVTVSTGWGSGTRLCCRRNANCRLTCVVMCGGEGICWGGWNCCRRSADFRCVCR
jgi:hypothetical protein